MPATRGDAAPAENMWVDALMRPSRFKASVPGGGSMVKPLRVSSLLVPVGGLLLATALEPCLATASANVASNVWYLKTSDFDSDSDWSFRLSWANTAAINWSLPTAQVLGAAVATAPLPFSEPKFTVPATGLPTSRAWTGVNYVKTDGLLPTIDYISALGSGSSSVGATYSAQWSISADASLSAGNNRIKAVGKDPWNMFPADVAGFGPTYSLYIPFSILGGESPVNGSTGGFGFDVTYTTAGANGAPITKTLLDIAVDGAHAVVTPSSEFGSSLRFLQRSDPQLLPTGSTLPGSAISPSQIESLLNSDLAPDSKINTPIHLGIVLSGIPTPTDLLGDGSIAQIGVDNSAFVASVPEPETYAMLLAGLGLVGWVGRRRKQKAG